MLKTGLKSDLVTQKTYTIHSELVPVSYIHFYVKGLPSGVTLFSFEIASQGALLIGIRAILYLETN